ncbi:pentatricopeptide repeat-containing protein At1g08070, chloroplastic [Jatropha curcas]|uniref:pentatricopeptide repeat-containing protein At1g08070, chloroplastic n=1 Tax=Jatropha curcas TaxID=180498 RepID=UPI0009D674E8|nr:pentatricopeptide repeat-containing protein At1g08070, chloroplastic [Jatropha curcas]
MAAWRAMLRQFDLQNDPFRVISLFKAMQIGKENDPVTDPFVYASLIKACNKVLGINEGKSIHSRVVKLALDYNLNVLNSLIHYYASVNGSVKYARVLFDKMPDRTVVTVNSMVSGFLKNNQFDFGLSLFKKVLTGAFGLSMKPNFVTLMVLISGCVENGGYSIGRLLHSYCCKTGKMVHVHIIASVEEIPVSLGTVLINMYSRCGSIKFARKVFEELPDKNIASWNSIIHGYVECGLNSEALRLFNLMKCSKVEADDVTMLGIISACRNSGELSLCIDIHSYIMRNDNLSRSNVLQNALVDMYAKCGNMARAKSVFDKMLVKDVISWTSIIVGHAINGEGEEALHAFRKMCAEKVEPNSVTFIAVLLACDHSGLVEEGQNLYDTMCKVYNIEPQIEHCGCMIDMLARAGMLDEANKFVKKMPVEPNTVIWRMMINACRVHGDFDLGLCLVSSLVGVKKSPKIEDHVISSIIFAETGRWNDVLHERSTVIAQKPSKVPGKSCISELTD